MPRFGDERRSQRYPSRTDCEIRFMESSQLVGGTARFVDISVLGVQLECDFYVPMGTVIAIYLENENPVFAHVVRDTTTPEGRHAIGASFVEGGISYGLFTSIAFTSDQLSMQTTGMDFVCTLR